MDPTTVAHEIQGSKKCIVSNSNQQHQPKIMWFQSRELLASTSQNWTPVTGNISFCRDTQLWQFLGIEMDQLCALQSWSLCQKDGGFKLGPKVYSIAYLACCSSGFYTLAICIQLNFLGQLQTDIFGKTGVAQTTLAPTLPKKNHRKWMEIMDEREKTSK